MTYSLPFVAKVATQTRPTVEICLHSLSKASNRAIEAVFGQRSVALIIERRVRLPEELTLSLRRLAQPGERGTTNGGSRSTLILLLLLLRREGTLLTKRWVMRVAEALRTGVLGSVGKAGEGMVRCCWMMLMRSKGSSRPWRHS